jgi:hypothetical protein
MFKQLLLGLVLSTTVVVAPATTTVAFESEELRAPPTRVSEIKQLGPQAQAEEVEPTPLVTNEPVEVKILTKGNKGTSKERSQNVVNVLPEQKVQATEVVEPSLPPASAEGETTKVIGTSKESPPQKTVVSPEMANGIVVFKRKHHAAPVVAKGRPPSQETADSLEKKAAVVETMDKKPPVLEPGVNHLGTNKDRPPQKIMATQRPVTADSHTAVQVGTQQASNPPPALETGGENLGTKGSSQENHVVVQDHATAFSRTVAEQVEPQPNPPALEGGAVNPKGTSKERSPRNTVVAFQRHRVTADGHQTVAPVDAQRQQTAPTLDVGGVEKPTGEKEPLKENVVVQDHPVTADGHKDPAQQAPKPTATISVGVSDIGAKTPSSLETAVGFGVGGASASVSLAEAQRETDGKSVSGTKVGVAATLPLSDVSAVSVEAADLTFDPTLSVTLESKVTDKLTASVSFNDINKETFNVKVAGSLQLNKNVSVTAAGNFVTRQLDVGLNLVTGGVAANVMVENIAATPQLSLGMGLELTPSTQLELNASDLTGDPSYGVKVTQSISF